MKTILRRAALLVAISALGLLAATVAVANPHTMYTCVKVTNGVHEVVNEVPESAVRGKTNAGFTCVPTDGTTTAEETTTGEVTTTEETTTEETTTGEVTTTEETTTEETTTGEVTTTEETTTEETGNGNPGNENQQDDDPGYEDPTTASAEVWMPQESRSLYCSTNGPAFRANGEGMGIGLNLPDSQGALMVELGLVKPATFYQGIGATCDQLPGFKDSGLWVDHVGDVVPGVAVYPLFIPA